MAGRKRNEELKVWVSSGGKGRNLVLEWREPHTHQRKTKSAGTQDKREAQRLAFELEEKLRRENGILTEDPTWLAFSQKYLDAQTRKGLRPNSLQRIQDTFGLAETLMTPKRMAQINTSWVEMFVRKIEETPGSRGKRSVSTINSYIRTLRAFLNYARGEGVIEEIRKYPFRGDKAERDGKPPRPLTSEEFERAISLLPRLVDGERKKAKIKTRTPEWVASWVSDWEFFLVGLLLSGLRLSEGLALSWDRFAESGFWVLDIGGGVYRIHIEGRHQKNGRTQDLALSVEFCELLDSVPVEHRRGFVFNPRPSKQRPTKSGDINTRVGEQTASKTVSRLFKKALIVVEKTEAGTEYATAHNLRDTFASRMAARVPESVLKTMMRHQSSSTTHKHYVDIQASDIEAAIRPTEQSRERAISPRISPRRDLSDVQK